MTSARLWFTVLLLPLVIWGQKGDNQWQLGGEVAFPTGRFTTFQTGVGAWGKGLWGVEGGQLTLSSSYSSFKANSSTENYKIKMRVVPLLAGYRFRMTPLYAEPGVGYGWYSEKIKSTASGTTTKTVTTNGGFTLGVSAGVLLGSLDAGVHFQAGYPAGGAIALVGLKVGYTFYSRQGSQRR